VNVAFSFDPLHFIGLLVCAFIAGLVGSFVGVIVTAIFTPSLDGQRLWKGLGLLSAVGAMTPVKLIVAFVTAVATMLLCSNIGTALLWAMGIDALIAFVFTVVVGGKIKV
jgi:hypothetical protein